MDGGPAGIMAAIKARQEGNEVLILEKMNSLGKKLLITGKGRCNITSSIDINEFIKNIPGNGKFLYSSFKQFNNQDIIKLLEDNGLKTKIERGNRVFPVSDSAKDVLNTFMNILKKEKIKIKTNSRVIKLIAKDNKIEGVKTESGEVYSCNKVVLATGGKSYPTTGSTGDGYILAKEVGHTITEIKPSLVPLTIKELDICQALQALSLKNIKITILDKNKVIYEDFGEMLFTHFGVSGPIIISASAILLRYKNIDDLLSKNEIKLIIDLKSALNCEKLEARILRDFESEKNKKLKNSLDNLLPQKMIPVIIKRTGIDENKKVNEITKQERKTLIQNLKEFVLTIKAFRGIQEAIVTAGGINIKEIDPRTMQSKIIEGLYFAGEIIDVDAYTGGFNLQIAYSTGVVAGSN